MKNKRALTLAALLLAPLAALHAAEERSSQSYGQPESCEDVRLAVSDHGARQL